MYINTKIKTNKYYVKTTKGGYNKCIQIKDNGCVLPNCVGYAWGRFIEAQGVTDCNLSRGNAENWYDYNDGYKRSRTPKLGSIICWAKGKPHNPDDGAGHVAFVEDIYDDGSILISESGYNSYYFKTEVVKPPYARGTKYTFQGFIENPTEFERSEDMPFKIGDYVYALEDIPLYTSIEYKSNTYTLKKGENAYVRYIKGMNVALANPDTQEYFSSAWTNQLDKLTKDAPQEDWEKKYNEEVVKNKALTDENNNLKNKINKAISDLQ